MDGAWAADRVRDKAADRARDKAADRVRARAAEWGAGKRDAAAPDRGHAEADPAPDNDRNGYETTYF